MAATSLQAAQPLSPPEILARAVENERRQEVIRSQYFSREHAERRESTRDQKPGKLSFSRDYEWIYLEGEPFRKLVATNARPLGRKEAEAENRRMQMTAAERRELRAKSKPNPHVINAAGDVLLADVLRFAEHRMVGEESISGRSAWVIQSTPKADSDAGESSQVRCYQYTFWIDQQEFAIVRQKYYIVRTGTDALPGTWSETRYSRVAEQLWFRTYMEGYFITGPPRPAAKWFQIHTFADYRKFDAATTITFDNGK